MGQEIKYKAWISLSEIVMYRNKERVRSFMTLTFKTLDVAKVSFMKELRNGSFAWAGFTEDNTELER